MPASAHKANVGGWGSDHPRLALIGDIRGSREAVDRAALQTDFQVAVDAGRKDAGPARVTDLTITVGDEFQGILGDAPAVLAVMHAVGSEMAPRRMAFGIGVGPVETPLPPPDEPAINIDGPCLRHAREAVQAAKDGDRWATVRGLPDRAVRQLDPLLHLVGSVRARWTDRQVEFVRRMRVRDDVQKAVAEDLRVSPSVVSESLAAARYHEVRAAQHAVADLLQERVDEATPGGST